MRDSLIVIAGVLTLLGLTRGLSAAASEPADTDAAGVASAADPVAEYRTRPGSPSVTRHEFISADERFEYRATAGTVRLAEDDGSPRADVFFTAYERLDAADGTTTAESDPTARPILFSFNGGPGSSSVWLHLGIFGPKRVAYADAVGNPGPPPHRVIDNTFSTLTHADLVFIDPVSTGYSRPAGEAEASDFHGVEPDIESVAEFIRLYLTRNNRWASPKFIAGESYGTTRAAGLARHLHDRHGIAVNGVILVSGVFDFGTLRFDTGNDRPYPLFLPTYAATAQYHGALDEPWASMPLKELIAEAERFAAGPYRVALFAGDRLDPAERTRIAHRMSDLTGLDAGYIERNRLRVPMDRFAKELLRDRGITVGRLDSRFTGVDLDDGGEGYEYDASYAAILANYTGSLMDWITRGLGYQSDLPYEILTGAVRPWDFGAAGNNRYVNVSDRLRGVMERLPELRVFVASGYFDLATPHFAFDHTLATMGLRDGAAGRVTVKYYEAGHMMYVHRPSLEAIGEDLREFIEGVPVGPAERP